MPYSASSDGGPKSAPFVRKRGSVLAMEFVRRPPKQRYW